MKPQGIKSALTETIQLIGKYSWLFSSSPGKDFTRTRKLSFEKVMTALLAFRGGSLANELLDFFSLDAGTCSSSAFVQQRAKILPLAFENLFAIFTKKTSQDCRYKGFRLFAVDGSDIQVEPNPNDANSYFPGVNGQAAYSLLHLNAMYDVLQHIYMDAILQKRRNADENGALTAMVDRSPLENVIVLADRGYESYNNLAHIQQKGWKFLIRIKSGKQGIVSGLTLPDTEQYDIPFHLKLTRKQSNDVKDLLKLNNQYKSVPYSSRFDFLPLKSRKRDAAVFYELHFRVVRFPISDSTYETIITNLDEALFPLPVIKKLYAMRWGIETSFRELKYTMGLMHLHSKKAEFIHQEIFAKLTMYNFCELITQPVVIQQANRKYPCKVNFSAAVHISLQFFLGKISPPRLEALLKKFISPIRSGRNFPRKLTRKASYSLLYRVA